MRRAGLVVSLWIALGVGLGCKPAPAPDGPPVARAFYFWRTAFALSAGELRGLTELGASRLYVRMFDLAWLDAEHRAVPVGPLVVPAGARVPAGVEVVPVVFVRDDVLRRAAAAPLAAALWAEVARKLAALGATPHELQIDCDWTERSRDAYFALLRAVRQEANRGGRVALSATIRLHQVKYRERTGVPPVDRGMLMFYNMGRFSADPDARAIFDAGSAERYLARVRDYPLALDLALPIWSWTMQIRDGDVVGLLQSTDPAELAGLDFLAPAAGDGDGRYVATRTAFVHGALIREGDLLKTEVTAPDDTLAAAALVGPHLAVARASMISAVSSPGSVPAGASVPPRTVALFDLSERNLRRHDSRSLDRVFRAVH